MATTISTVTLNTATYTALSSSATAASVFLKRGQSIRLSVDSGVPSADTANYVLLSGPGWTDDAMVRRHDFTLTTNNIYGRVQSGADLAVQVIAT